LPFSDSLANPAAPRSGISALLRQATGNALAFAVHKMSLSLPKYEMYEEGSQVRRSSKGITSCIVEGYGRKKYKADFVKFLIYAHASCDETILHLSFIKDTHQVAEVKDFIDSYNQLGGKINKFIQYVEKEWK
jgi:four helix bundle protein